MVQLGWYGTTKQIKYEFYNQVEILIYEEQLLYELDIFFCTVFDKVDQPAKN